MPSCGPHAGWYMCLHASAQHKPSLPWMNRHIFITSGQELPNLVISQVDNCKFTLKAAPPCPQGINCLSSLYVQVPSTMDPSALGPSSLHLCSHPPWSLHPSLPLFLREPRGEEQEGMLLSFSLHMVGSLLHLQRMAMDGSGACLDSTQILLNCRGINGAEETQWWGGRMVLMGCVIR